MSLPINGNYDKVERTKEVTYMHATDSDNKIDACTTRDDIMEIVYAMDDEQILAALTLLRQLQKGEEP